MVKFYLVFCAAALETKIVSAIVNMRSLQCKTDCMAYSGCQKNVPIAERFFATTLMPPSFFRIIFMTSGINRLLGEMLWISKGISIPDLRHGYSGLSCNLNQWQLLYS
jgi:hypothetical protein